jgi:hypothetical protein
MNETDPALRAELEAAAAAGNSATLTAAVKGGRTTRALSMRQGEVVGACDDDPDDGYLQDLANDDEVESLRRWRERHPA